MFCVGLKLAVQAPGGMERVEDASSHVVGDSRGDVVVELAAALDYRWRFFPSSLERRWHFVDNSSSSRCGCAGRGEPGSIVAHVMM